MKFLRIVTINNVSACVVGMCEIYDHDDEPKIFCALSRLDINYLDCTSNIINCCANVFEMSDCILT